MISCRSIRTLLLGLYTALFIAAFDVPCGGAEKDNERDLKSMQGTWVVVTAERDGDSLDRIKGNKLIVKDNQFTIIGKNFELRGHLTLDASASPKKLDMQHQEGALRDKKWEGIYKLEKNKLTICYSEADSGKERPDEFATRSDQNRLLIVMERADP